MVMIHEILSIIVYRLIGLIGNDFAACLALVDELKWEVANIDPKKTVKVGSYRVNPKGEQNLQEVGLRSLMHKQTSLMFVALT